MLHLTPNAVMVGHLCSFLQDVHRAPAFGGSLLSYLRGATCPEKQDEQPARPIQEFLHIPMKDKWDEWHQKWVYISVESPRMPHPPCCLHDGPAVIDQRNTNRLALEPSFLVDHGIGEGQGHRVHGSRRFPSLEIGTPEPEEPCLVALTRSHPDDLEELGLDVLLAASLKGGSIV
jgi:hypothetical protein